MMVALIGLLPVAATDDVLVVGGMAPMGNANAWVEAQSRTAHEGQSNYKSKYLAVAPALNHGGVFPTCVAMVLMYYNDQLGLFPSHIRDFLSPEGQSLIASPEYFADYYYPDDYRTAQLMLDKSGALEARSNRHLQRRGNCVADWCPTSQSFIGLRSQESLAVKAGPYSSDASISINGFTQYFRIRCPEQGPVFELEAEIHRNRFNDGRPTVVDVVRTPEGQITAAYIWNKIVESIDAGRPLVGLGKTQRFANIYQQYAAVTVVGYAFTPDYRAFAAYTGSSMEMQWYRVAIVPPPPVAPAKTGDPVTDALAESDYIIADGNYRSMIFRMMNGDGSPLEVLVEFDFFGTPKTLSGNVVHRFYNPTNGAYFFTAFESEAQAVVDHNPAWEYQGPVFEVEYGPAEGNLPVYRFLNTRVGAHFFTMNEAEKASVIANLSHQYQYEGVAFYARADQLPYDAANPSGVASYPIWRCYLPQTSSHYFTANYEEVRYIQENVDRSLIYVEGIAWYSGRIFDVP